MGEDEGGMGVGGALPYFYFLFQENYIYCSDFLFTSLDDVTLPKSGL